MVTTEHGSAQLDRSISNVLEAADDCRLGVERRLQDLAERIDTEIAGYKDEIETLCDRVHELEAELAAAKAAAA